MRCRVLVPRAGPGFYDYRLPPGLAVRPGDFVRVPLRRSEVTGVVWDPAPESARRLPPEKLRPVRERIAQPGLPDLHRRFLDWATRYTLAAPGALLRLSLSSPSLLAASPPRPVLALNPDPPAFRLTAPRARLLAAARKNPAPAAQLARAAQVSPAVVAGLRRCRALIPQTSPPDAEPRPIPALNNLRLSPRQQQIARQIRARFAPAAFAPCLLDGVTGAGKTEVYFDTIAAALEQGRQALVLLPEIALADYFLDRFQACFNAAPALFHSALGPGPRRRVWQGVLNGRLRVVIGARSALWLPFKNLGLIVVDEEHDAAFKQEDGVFYQARDMAVARAFLGKIPVVLSSATPSLESLVNAGRGRYAHFRLPARHGGARLPAIEALDMRRQRLPKERWLSARLQDEIARTLRRGEQTLLFLNRRGFAPLMLCRACGHRFACPDCTAWLVAHLRPGALLCHHCGHRRALPSVCPACRATGKLAACGPGIERIAAEAADLFPQARITCLARDLPPEPDRRAAIFADMRARRIDILIGTQIIAKGLHFPHLTLAGIIDADLGLANGDLRAAERSWQLLQQVAGRTGRARHPGRALLQTYMPDHPMIRALTAGERETFLARESAQRQKMQLPPFGHLAAIIVSGAALAPVEQAARALAAHAAKTFPASVRLLGPAPAPLARLRGRHRLRLLIKAATASGLHACARELQSRCPPPAGVRIAIDIDPYHFL